ncbi:hypothetical protein [Lichenifustis flavocetrariae]|uniref:Uncharacterized protein n=1 Tax=Lichenifustis flavocetrariae TaxID=2949735 RepID=A0AA41Z6W5_9HYPH|nr:hypothetical protein [Lichenifustis flavocetrariae]MCW6510362.1 hypothetical protein [Lichenifustis flavocetrariae]
MSHIVSDRDSRPVLKTLIGTGLLLMGLVGSLMAVLTLPWLVLRLVLWATR